VRGIRLGVLLLLVLISVLVSFGFAYIAVQSQNPHEVSEPLYGPGDFVGR
jgi:hypothetical protein